MGGFSLATACRAAAFSAAAYESPARISRTEMIGGSAVSFFEDGSGAPSPVPLQESRCTCYAIDADRFAFIENSQTDTQGNRMLRMIERMALIERHRRLDPCVATADCTRPKCRSACADLSLIHI